MFVGKLKTRLLFLIPLSLSKKNATVLTFDLPNSTYSPRSPNVYIKFEKCPFMHLWPDTRFPIGVTSKVKVDRGFLVVCFFFPHSIHKRGPHQAAGNLTYGLWPPQSSSPSSQRWCLCKVWIKSLTALFRVCVQKESGGCCLSCPTFLDYFLCTGLKKHQQCHVIVM